MSRWLEDPPLASHLPWSCQILPRPSADYWQGLCSPINPTREDPRPALCWHPPSFKPPHLCHPSATHALPPPAVAPLPAHWGHLRSLRVNVSNPFAIIDGEIGPDNVFVVDPERSFNNHVVWENQAKEYWVARAPCSRSHSHSVDERDPWENKG